MQVLQLLQLRELGQTVVVEPALVEVELPEVLQPDQGRQSPAPNPGVAQRQALQATELSQPTINAQ